MSLNSKQFIAHHIDSLPPSGIRAFFSAAAEMPDVISLGVGEPDFVTPWNICERAVCALEKGMTSYTDNRGLYGLRQEISLYLRALFSLEYNPATEILVTTGVSEGLDLALRALINPGDKVLYHEPCYVSYYPGIAMAHGVPVPVSTRARDNFTLTVEALQNAWEPGCKLLMLNFPTNPTGAVAELDELKKIAAFVQEKDLFVISDEIYAEMTYGANHTSIASLPGMSERTLFLHGFSKAFAMTGFRIGYACGPDWLISIMTKIHAYSILCAPILSQEAAIEALKNGAESVASMREEYMRRRDFFVRRLREMGVACHTPQATFYAFADIRALGIDDNEFALRLLKEGKVAAVPGRAFGESGRGFLRCSFSTSYENLIQATDRMERFIETLG
jgi:aminotransferase